MGLGAVLYRQVVGRPARLLALALVLLGSSFVFTSGEARADTIWTSTLTVGNVGFGVGCTTKPWLEDRTQCPDALSVDEFTIDSQVYKIHYVNLKMERVHVPYTRIEDQPLRQLLSVGVRPALPDDARDTLSLYIGSKRFALGTSSVGGGSIPEKQMNFYWREPGLSWGWGNEISLKIVDAFAPPTEPNRPTAHRGNKQAQLRWRLPLADGGKPITGYEYRYTATDAFPTTWTAVTDGSDAGTSTADERSVTVTGLTNNTTYKFQVRALNEQGASEPSKTVTATPNAPPTAANNEITVREDTAYILRPVDYGFSDEDEGDMMRGVIPRGMTPGSRGRVFNVSGIGPVFLPQRNEHGNNLATLRFKVTDGKDESIGTYRMTFHVTSVNDPATGKPTISGTRQQGQTMTASTAGIRDVDGLPDNFEFQWIRVDADGSSNSVEIAGETAATYRLSAADVGKRVKVKVSFTDQDSYREQLTSDTSGVVQAQGTVNAVPTASDKTIVTNEDKNYKLKASDFGFADANTGDVLVSVKIVTLPAAGSLHLSGAALSAGSVVRAYDIKANRLAFRPAPNAHGTPYASFTFTVNDGTADSESPNTITMNVTPVNDPPTGKLKLERSGDLWIKVLATDIRDADGLGNARFRYEWVRTDPGGVETWGGTSNVNVYYLSRRGEAAGTKMRWRLTYTDDDGNAETVVSKEVYLASPTAAAKEAPHIISGPTISSPGDDGVWTPGEKVEISFTFSEEMTVLAYNGVPSVGLNLGGTEARIAEYDRGNSTATLVFSHTLSSSDGSHNSMIVPADSMALNDGVIRSRSTTLNASLTHNAGAKISESVQLLGGLRGGSGQESTSGSATGRPGIDGTPTIGETLTATTSDIQDSDGMLSAVFAYQWIRQDPKSGVNTIIGGATASTYVVASDDVGKVLKVRVTFTDDGNNQESVTSAATAAVKRPLTATVKNVPSSHDGERSFALRLIFNEEVDISFRTLQHHAFTVTNAEIVNARRVSRNSNKSWEITVQPDGNPTVTLLLPVTTDCTSISAICSNSGKKFSSPVEINVPGPKASNNPATGAPTISGTAQVDQTLTADTSGIADADGLTDTVFRYQWIRQRSSTAESENIEEASGSTYVVTETDQGASIRVRVTFTDDAGNDESVVSRNVEVPQAQQGISKGSDGDDGKKRQVSNSPATGAPTISGTAQVGETLISDTSGISDKNGLANATFSYQWLADDVALEGATAATYAVVAGDVGKAIKVRVTFTDDAGNTESVTSPATAAVTSVDLQEPPQSPTNLTSSVNSDGHIVLNWSAPDDGSVTGYQILRRRPAKGEHSLQVYVSDTQSKATTYKDTNVAMGVEHVYRVKAINSAGRSGLSNYVSATPVVGLPPTNLTATVNSDGHVVLNWEAPDDDSVTGYQILRRRPNKGEHSLQIYVSDTGSTATAYTDTNVTMGTQHIYRVKSINTKGQSGWSNYVSATPEVGLPPTNLRATVNSDGNVVLSWEAPNDDSVTGYMILRRRPSQGEHSLQVYVSDTQSTATTYTDTNVTAGVQHVYRVKAINAKGQSGWSNYVKATP